MRILALTRILSRGALGTCLATGLGWTLAAFTLGALGAGAAAAAPVLLDSWTAASYPAVGGFANGSWSLAADFRDVTQTANGQPTVFYSDFSARNTDVNGGLTISGGDDDYAGFVLGYSPGDITSESADYLLIDWKGGTQSFNFSGTGGADATPGSTAQRGLAVSRVTGIPTADELWGHQDFVENPLGGVTELARAANLGDVGWTRSTEYAFRFVFTATTLDVYVDDVLEIAIDGNFSDGRLGFYNFSQGGVRYSAFDSTVVPEPGTALLMGIGLVALATRRERAA